MHVLIRLIIEAHSRVFNSFSLKWALLLKVPYRLDSQRSIFYLPLPSGARYSYRGQYREYRAAADGDLSVVSHFRLEA